MASADRFAEIVEEQIPQIINEAIPINTKRQTNWSIVISIFLNYASLILYYLDTTEFLFIKILVQSSRNCVLRALYSDCILKGLEAVSSCFVYKYTHLLAAQ